MAWVRMSDLTFDSVPPSPSPWDSGKSLMGQGFQRGCLGVWHVNENKPLYRAFWAQGAGGVAWDRFLWRPFHSSAPTEKPRVREACGDKDSGQGGNSFFAPYYQDTKSRVKISQK